MELRQFLYRDDGLVREFLSQIEGGLFEQDTQIERAGRKGGVGGRLQAGPVGISGERAKERSEEIQRVVLQTPASEFERLFSVLHQEGLVRMMGPIDLQTWAEVRRGEIVELESVIRPTGLHKISQLFEVFKQLQPLAEAAGAEATLDDQAVKMFDLVQGISGANRDTFPIVASLASAPQFKFVATLNVPNLTTPADALEGEAVVFAKIQRKLAEGETYLMPAVFGGLERMLEQEHQEDLARVFDAPQAEKLGLGSPMVKHPAALVTAISIYR